MNCGREATPYRTDLRAWTLGAAGTVALFVGVTEIVVGGIGLAGAIIRGGAGGTGSALAVTSGGLLVSVAAGGRVVIAVGTKILIVDGILVTLVGANVAMFAASAGGPPSATPPGSGPRPQGPAQQPAQSAGPRDLEDLLSRASKGSPGKSNQPRMKGDLAQANKDFDAIAQGPIRNHGGGIRSSTVPGGSTISVRPGGGGASATIQVNSPGGSVIKIRYSP